MRECILNKNTKNKSKSFRSVFALLIVLFLFLATTPFFIPSNWLDYHLIQSLFVNLCMKFTFYRHQNLTQGAEMYFVQIYEKNPKVSGAFLRKRHISDVTTTLFYLLLLISSFWTEFSKHVYTLNLDSNALNMHMTLFSLERSMQQGVQF